MGRRKAVSEDNPSFEEALSQLEDIVQQLEAGELVLDEALAKFTTGMSLADVCLKKLNFAEQQVTMIVRNDSDEEIVQKPFNLMGEESC